MRVRTVCVLSARCLYFQGQILDLLENLPTTRNRYPGNTSTKGKGKDTSETGPTQFGSRSLSRAMGAFGSRMSLAAVANGGNGVVKRQGLALKLDSDNQKYVAGLRWIRVRTREEAHAVFVGGQADRQVFSTVLNQHSSRSHGIFEVKVVRVHNGAPMVS